MLDARLFLHAITSAVSPSCSLFRYHAVVLFGVTGFAESSCRKEKRKTKRNTHHYQYVFILGFNSMLPINYCYAGDRILQLFGLMLCLLMHRLLKSPVHPKTWYLLIRGHNRYCYSRIYMIYLGSSEIQHKKVKM